MMLNGVSNGLAVAAENGHGGVNLARATRAVEELLDALGVNTDPRGAPRHAAARRSAVGYAELLRPRPLPEMTTFPNDGGYDELVAGLTTSPSPPCASTTCCRS